MKEPLTEDAFKQLCQYSLDNLILPEDALRQYVGLPTSEPLLVPPEAVYGKKQVDRFLSILAFLYKKKKRLFEIYAPEMRGSKRIYFSKDWKEIYKTGSSNDSQKIPESDWYVAINSPSERKSNIIAQLMQHLGFSFEYSNLVASTIYDDGPYLPFKYRRKYWKIDNAI